MGYASKRVERVSEMIANENFSRIEKNQTEGHKEKTGKRMKRKKKVMEIESL